MLKKNAKFCEKRTNMKKKKHVLKVYHINKSVRKLNTKKNALQNEITDRNENKKIKILKEK